ncbi:MAG: hypothetical protein ACTSUC_15390 [Promethearchaeota archaeon]
MSKDLQCDNRMQWILLLEECEKSSEKKTYSTEYEICSEVRIPGVLNYGNGSLLCGLLQEKNQNGLYTYTVRVKHLEKEYKFDEKNYQEEGYFFKDGLIGEIIALFSVFFQARFYLKATILGNLSPSSMKVRTEETFQHTNPSHFLHYEMFSDQNRNWTDKDGLKLFLDSVKAIDRKYHLNLIRAFFWYSEAIKEIGVDHQLFFIKMVSSVEALLKFVEIPSDSLEKKLREMVEEKIFSNDEAHQIGNWLQNRKIRMKFKSFLQKNSNRFYKGGNRNAKHCYILKKELKKYANRIYDARSTYLHSGKPMYLSFDTKTEDAKYWDLDPSTGMMADRKKFPESEKLPRVRWFERIVNHCFKNFIKDSYHKNETNNL